MPSGHVAIVSFASLGVLAAEAAAGRMADFRLACGALAAAVAASRVARMCHTPLQTAAGAALGGLLAFAFWALVRARGRPERHRAPALSGSRG